MEQFNLEEKKRVTNIGEKRESEKQNIYRQHFLSKFHFLFVILFCSSVCVKLLKVEFVVQSLVLMSVFIDVFLERQNRFVFMC